MTKRVQEIRDRLASEHFDRIDRDYYLERKSIYIGPLSITSAFETGFDAGYALARKEAEALVEALEYLDRWQGERSCNASVYEIDDDTFELLQFTVHQALSEWRKND